MPLPDNVYLLSAVVAAILLVLSFRDPFYGLLSYFTVMMTRPGLHFSVLEAIRIELIIGLIVLLEVFLTGRAGMKLSFAYNEVNKYLFFFFMVIFLSFIQAWDHSVSWNTTVIEFIKVYAFFIMILTLVDSTDRIRHFLWSFALLTAVINYEGLYLYFAGKATYVFQNLEVAIGGEGFAEGHVQTANMQIQGLPVAIYLFLSEKKILAKSLFALASFFAVIGVIASGSRGGFLGLIVIVMMIVYYSKRRAMAFAILTIICLLSIPYLTGAYLSWMGSIVENKDLSAQSRIGGLIHGIEIMIRRPILGVGPGCYPLARKAWFGWGLHAHSHPGQLFGDLGLLGTFAWGFFIVYVFRNLKKAKRLFYGVGMQNMAMLIIGIQVALIVRLFEGLFSHSLYIFFWYMMAALSIVMLKQAEEVGGSCIQRA